MQFADTLAVIWDYLRCARSSELGGHGLFHYHIVYDARFCGDVNCLLPLAHEQGSGLYHVSVVLCLCCCIADVRIWFHRMPILSVQHQDKDHIHILPREPRNNQIAKFIYNTIQWINYKYKLIMKRPMLTNRIVKQNAYITI